MAAKIKWSEAKIAQLEREGRGKGAGAEYKPWVQVNDFSSRGYSRRVFSQKTGRVHHLLSEVEWQLFLLLEFSPAVLDIREQYPLKREQTLSIATELGIRHPTYPGTSVSTVMTCDFLVILQEHGEQVVRAFSCKRENGVDGERDVEKLEIERSYFSGRDVPHHLVFDSSLPKNKIDNVYWCRGASINDDDTYEYDGAFAEHRQRLINELSRKPVGSLTQFCDNYDRLTGVKPGTGLRVVRALLWNRELLTDLNTPDPARQPAVMFSLAPNVAPQARRA
ncbi:TnsA endonuclease N-terminal domain-containing protein [Uliginosibacterium sp. TH139]|uniref:TnsA endonuclease N-terminal domain-containing protein n=1 Tax=Uliginosibacterium sp. TH139 TaxID=2067453 RepID=UPI0013041294|nr:TnsA endonuclease N-terminal domain-containing protein [Uliginosibacterium sp. TH139]